MKAVPNTPAPSTEHFISIFNQQIGSRRAHPFPGLAKMPPPNRYATPSNLKKVGAILPQVATGTVALAAIYMYVYGWDESQQIRKAERDAATEAKK